MRRQLRRIHIWLGWAVGIPLLIWTVSGLVMVAFPIETVRGEDLLSEPRPVELAAPVAIPPTGPRPVVSLSLEQRAIGPRWLVRFADGEVRMADPATGRVLPPLSAPEAVAEVQARYRGEARVAAVDRTSAEQPPLELRRPIAAWRVTMTDSTRFYVNGATGEIVARRTSLWRFYDFMWGLHIMDPGGRDNFNNVWVRAFAGIGAVSVVLGVILLPMTIRRRRRRARTAAAD
ncbi:MAG: hypothetical protein JWL74_1357 [Alphaproteobacteria bacterium]|nr:hypothetical protein [Alphaproteobacteria bacterium]